MECLLIEDDKYKSLEIEKTLKDVYPSLQITVKDSYSSGVKESLLSKYDFILLDMSMPTFDISVKEKGGRPRNFAGKEIMIQMHRRRISTPVIVITQFENFGEGVERTTLRHLEEQLNALNPDIFKGIVFYSIIEKNWQIELVTMINAI